MRLTKYHYLLTILGLLVAGIYAVWPSATRGWALVMLITTGGLFVGLGVAFPQWQFFGPSLCRVPTLQKAVVLTFDDGPDPLTTPALLALLARRRVAAVFFLVGRQVERYPDLSKQIVSEGHQVENHSFAHSHWTNLFTVTRLKSELLRTQAVIQTITGHTPKYFRPPMGLTNLRVMRAAADLGLCVVGYSARGLDKKTVQPTTIVQRLVRRLQPGAILLLHDGGVPVNRLLTTVDQLLDGIENEGYQILTFDQIGL